jgi:hypothetical protein
MSENKPDRDPRKVAGAVLIVIGALLLILQYATGVAYSIMFLIGGSAFLIAYFGKRTYGFLIPGCIMLGIGVGRLGEEASLPVDDASAIGLGIGFVAIYGIDRLFNRKSHWWPLIPGLILFVNGIGSDFDFGRLISRGWPVILIIVGLLFLGGKIGSDSRKDTSGPPQTPPAQ